MILVVDHHDSFTFNLVHGLQCTGMQVRVVDGDAIAIEDVVESKPRGVVLSPGPGRPEQAALALQVVRQLGGQVPILGVCLGHQVVCAAYGARVVHAERMMHGRISQVHHDGRGLFTGLPSPLAAGRYHSLVVAAESLPPELVATAHTEQGELMAVRHRSLAIESVQFHPESFLTEHGLSMLAHWAHGLPARSPFLAAEASLSRHG